MDQSDDELLILLATDLPGSFAFLVEQYQHRLYSFAYRLTGNFHDAQDIAQEAFMSAYVALENYPVRRIRDLKLQAWLYRVTLNVFTHHARGSRLRLIPLSLLEDSPLLTLEGNAEEHPERMLEHLEQRQELEALVVRLPELYRVAVACYYFENLSYQEVANLLDRPLGTVKSIISRGVRLLRAMVGSTYERKKGNRTHELS
jgi:RNA polymerase sigma-70 factor, ECF subfamily